MAILKKQLLEQLKKTKVRLIASLVVVMVVGVVAVSSGVSAVSRFSWSNVENKVASMLAGKVDVEVVEDEPMVEDEDGVLGSATNSLLPGPAFGVGKDLQYSVNVDLADATTTFAFATPFLAVTSSPSNVVLQYDIADKFGWTGATTTVSMVKLTMTSSTPTAYSIGCGGGVTPYATSSVGVAILTADAIPALTKPVLENNVGTSAGAQVGGGSVAKIHIGPNAPYLVCRVYSSALTEFSATDGVSPGRATVRFSRTR